jgi:hypothetical protein
MPFVAGRGAWPSALSRPRGFRVHRNESEDPGEAPEKGAGFGQKGQSEGYKAVTTGVGQRERERRRSPLVSIPLLGTGFSGHWGLEVRSRFGAAQEGSPRIAVHRLYEPNRLSLGRAYKGMQA